MHKFTAILVLALFVISMVPLAFADIETAQVEPEMGVTAEPEMGINAKHKLNDKINPKNISPRDQVVSQRNQMDKKPLLGHAVEVGKERVKELKKFNENARERISAAKEKFEDAKVNLQEKKDQLSDAHERLKACKEENPEECRELVKDIRRGVKEQLHKHSDLVGASLDRLKDHIENSDMTDEEKEELLEKIADKESAVEDAKEALDALGEDATNEEIKEAKEKLKEAWLEIKPVYHWVANMLLNHKLENVLMKMENSIERLETKAQEAGLELDEKIEDLKDVLESANDAIESSKEIYLEAESPGDVKKANEYQKEARQHLKDAQNIMRAIMKDIKDAMHDIKLEESADDESIDSEETEYSEEE